jgi:hypothetical protein
VYDLPDLGRKRAMHRVNVVRKDSAAGVPRIRQALVAKRSKGFVEHVSIDVKGTKRLQA